tara:strand:- start:792 stop:1049 length:258 start_codon:yes stop_codon:yes gene_type:complete
MKDIINSLVFKSSVVSVILNVILALALSPFATKDEIKPPNGANKLSFKSQIMHMLVHHGQVILTSSLIVFVLTGLSVYLGNSLKL